LPTTRRRNHPRRLRALFSRPRHAPSCRAPTLRTVGQPQTEEKSRPQPSSAQPFIRSSHDHRRDRVATGAMDVRAPPKAQSKISTLKSSAPRQTAKWPQKRRWDGRSSWRGPRSIASGVWMSFRPNAGVEEARARPRLRGASTRPRRPAPNQEKRPRPVRQCRPD
jgi:hypothetical protein